MGAPLGAWLVARARAEGFDDAEVVPASTQLDDAPRLVEAVGAGRLAPFPWMAETLEQRTDLRRRLPWAVSVLVVVQSYFAGHHADLLDAAALAGKAKVSRYAWGGDYHGFLRRRLRRLRRALLDEAGGGRCAPFLDVDAVCERAWAKAAGLGFVGKSGMLIHRGLGTWTFLGGLATDVNLGPCPRLPVADACGSCTACLDACPTQAITAPHVVDARRCLVTWNIEEAEDARGDAPGMTGHGWAAGCDVCQEVCPWNRFAKRTTEARLHPRAGHVAFGVDDAPTDVEGTPLARPGVEALPRLAARALKP
ncbi:MAG: tRNA epoxyqueuosine(34) reductase QueG [Deltaproteobacteria bacterium]|nr:tRNA epoxyqueuosine(34) reductase QueG [Deltaproteobacteria bacterium]